MGVLWTVCFFGVWWVRGFFRVWERGFASEIVSSPRFTIPKHDGIRDFLVSVFFGVLFLTVEGKACFCEEGITSLFPATVRAPILEATVDAADADLTAGPEYPEARGPLERRPCVPMSVMYMLGLRIPDWGALGALMFIVEEVRVPVDVAVVLVAAAAAVLVVADVVVLVVLVVVVVAVVFVVEIVCFFGAALGTGAKRDLFGTVSFLVFPVRGAGLMGMMAFFTDAKLCFVMPILVDVEGATVDVAVPMRDFEALGVLGVPKFTRL